MKTTKKPEGAFERAMRGLRLPAPQPTIPANWPAVMDVPTAALYLSVSEWSVRSYVAQGLLPVVTMPALPARAGERQRDGFKRTLISRAALDSFIAQREAAQF